MWSNKAGVTMKTDVLTLAAIIFFVGILVSSLGLTEAFEESDSTPRAEIQQSSGESRT